MLAPIYELLFGRYKLALTEDQVIISYNVYKAEESSDMQEILDKKLAPGKMNCYYFLSCV